jgi:hypothetical protein
LIQWYKAKSIRCVWFVKATPVMIIAMVHAPRSIVMSVARRRFVCLLSVLALAGCSGDGGPANRRPTKPVKVTVTYKGAPVENATVTFINQEGDSAPAFGRTDAQGVAKMKTYVEDDGAVLGAHKVTIIKSEAQGGGSAASQDSPDYVPPGPGGTPLPVVKHMIPEKYASPTAGLTAEVKDSGPNEFTFDLKD